MRNPGATWVVPNEDEWFKAAYYDSSVPKYWNFPTQSDAAPTAEPPPGGANSANYNMAVTPAPNLTDVGAYTTASNFYGTFDQGGNVMEWLETLGNVGLFRKIRGGSWTGGGSFLLKQVWVNGAGGRNVGFRVAVIPEPSTFILCILGVVGLGFYRRLRKEAA